MEERPGVYLLPLVIILALASSASAQVSGQRSPQQSGIYLINDGDSLMSVNGSSNGLTSLSFAVPLLKGVALAANTSISGGTMGQIIAPFPENVGSKYDKGYQLFIVHSLGGGNDIR